MTSSEGCDWFVLCPLQKSPQYLCVRLKTARLRGRKIGTVDKIYRYGHAHERPHFRPIHRDKGSTYFPIFNPFRPLPDFSFSFGYQTNQLLLLNATSKHYIKQLMTSNHTFFFKKIIIKFILVEKKCYIHHQLYKL